MPWPDDPRRPTLPYPDWFSPLERARVDDAALKAAAPLVLPDYEPGSLVVVIGFVQQNYPSDAAAVSAVVGVCAAIVDSVIRQRARWPVDRALVHRAAEDLCEAVAQWAYAWHPTTETTARSTFGDQVRAVVERMSWWQDFVATTVAATTTEAASLEAPRAIDDRVPFTIAEAAERLGISDDKLRRMEKAGQVKFIRLPPRIVKVPQAEVDRLLKTGQYPPA